MQMSEQVPTPDATQNELDHLRAEITYLRTQLVAIDENHTREIRQLQDSLHSLLLAKTEKKTKKSLLRGKYTNQLFEGHKSGVTCLQFDETTLVTGSSDKSVRIWDRETETCIKVISGHQSGVNCVQFVANPDSRIPSQVISAGWDKNIRVWESGSEEEKLLKAHVNVVRCLQVCGDKMVSGASDKFIFVWDLKEYQCELILKGHDGDVNCVEMRGSTLVSGSGDNTVKIWNVDNGKCVSTLKGHTADVYCTKFSDNYVVSGGADKTLRVWDTQSGDIIRTLSHSESVSSCALEGNLIMTGCGDNVMRLWDLRCGQIMRVVKAHTGPITCLQLLGNSVATGSADRTSKIWSFNM